MKSWYSIHNIYDKYGLKEEPKNHLYKNEVINWLIIISKNERKNPLQIKHIIKDVNRIQKSDADF